MLNQTGYQATVDIIVPAYNAAHFLPFALDSVIAQTFADWRILLVDDGSQDATPELAAVYGEKLGERFKYLRQENAGLPAARNTAIRHATAEFLAILDADDRWLPRRLESSLARFAQDAKIGITHGGFEWINAAGEVIGSYDARTWRSEGYVASHLYMRTLDLPCPTVTLRRQAVVETGFFDESLIATEDRDLWLRIAQQWKVAVVPEIIAQYRVSQHSMSRDPDRMTRAQLQFVAKHYGSPGCGWGPRRVALGWIYRQRAEAESLRLQPWAALRSGWKAVALNPFDRHNLRTAASLLLRSAGLRRGPSRSATR